MIRLEKVTFMKFRRPVFVDTDWEMKSGENWAITGPVGAGKTSFLELLEGRLTKTKGRVLYDFPAFDDPKKHIAALYFNDPSVRYENYYSQQRYNATEVEGVITVRRFLDLRDEESVPELDALNIRELLDAEIIKLSNGQFRKMLIVKALMKKKRLLLLDSPYTGLDRRSREYISELLNRVVLSGVAIVMTTENVSLPDCITHVAEIRDFSLARTFEAKDFRPPQYPPPNEKPLPKFFPAPRKSFDVAVRLNGVTVAYGDKKVVEKIDWTVAHGDKWALTGPNGSGKTMLLSLVFADNPQAYSNDILLFDRRRGTGESIWDIKDNIGFASPETQLFFRKGKTCREVALSGLHENPYRPAQVSDEVSRFIDESFDYFSMRGFDGQPFESLSTARRNIVLLIRALAKNPPMLVLDEPFQGFDLATVEAARRLLDLCCVDRTLIFVSHRPEEFPSCIDKFYAL